MAQSARRGMWLAVLVCCTALAGFFAGTAVGGRYLVPAGSGLAGPPAALGYGLLAAFVAALAAGVLGRRMPATRLRAVAVCALLLVVVVGAWLVYSVAALRAHRRAAAGLDAPRPAATDLRLEAHIADTYEAGSYRELRLDGTTWRVQWTAPGPQSPTCAASLTASEAQAVIERVDALEASLDAAPDPCAGTVTPITHGVGWRHGGATHSVEGGAECLQRDGPWPALVHALGRIPITAVADARARCD
jgi:hypothetical protein